MMPNSALLTDAFSSLLCACVAAKRERYAPDTVVVLVLALLSSLCFGIAFVTGRVGLRTLYARSGAAISIPTATLLFIVISPFTLDLEGFSLAAAALFAGVGLFFPAIVTILTFRSNELLGPTATSAVSITSPLSPSP